MADEQAKGPESERESNERHLKSGARRPGLTPEQRRFLNKPRAEPNELPVSPVPSANVDHAPEIADEPKKPTRAERMTIEPTSEEPDSATEEKRPAPAATLLPQADKASRAIELQQALLILGGLLVLGLTFYGGMKLNYLRYLIASRHAPALGTEGGDLYPGVAPGDLVQQALLAERAGNWQDGVERFMAAKRKDLGYRGILFRVGKILYDHRNFEPADSAFERAIAFGENVEASAYYRGLIAVRRRDLATAEQFFGSAISAAPFVSDYHYYLAETLRLDLKPKEAFPHYERAALLARDAQDESVCRFKMRMAQIEAAEEGTVAKEMEKKKAAGSLPVDWLMTAAALQLRAGNIEQARQLVMEARDGKSPGLFASCVNDIYFHGAAEKYPELAEALHLDLDLQVPFPE